LSIDKSNEFCHDVLMTDLPKPDPRHQAILTAAFEVFARYGFRRTSMEDIAQAAGMSRAALYLHYRNKEDIFQSLVQIYFDKTCAEVARVLALDLPPVKALSAAFAAQGGPIIEALLNSPHGAEFMDAKTLVSADIVGAGEARLTAIYADWLRRETAAGRVALDGFGDADATAATMIAALNGMKAGVVDYAGYAAAVERLAVMLGRAVRV
jgi:AcrR family transcriptional regulator